MAEKSLLRFLTCGSVDDGKSTLLGRLLLDARLVPEDVAAEADGDPARLFDGLEAEREQGITIDVAYRYFETATRKYIAADCPGHEQYTRNMVTGASTADAAVILLDASKGVLAQTRRHAFICTLLGLRRFVVAVNKIDLIGHDRATFERLREQVEGLGLPVPIILPVAGRDGENVVRRSPLLAWFEGPTLLEALEAVAVEPPPALPLRLPVQLALRPDATFRGVAGTLASGTLTAGQRVRILPSGRETVIASLHGPGIAGPGAAVTVTLADEVDCARGDMIVAVEDAPEIADRFEATLVWLHEAPMLPGRSYLLKLATQTAGAQIEPPRHRIDVNTRDKLAARTLELNEIGVVHLSTDRPLVFEPYERSRELGGFILIDRLSGATVAAGMIRFALRRAHNIHWQPTTVDRDARAALKGQRPAVVWLTGVSGAGKSTIADLVEAKLAAKGRHTFLLDGDNVRHGLNRDLGFTAADRVENIRRVGEVAKLMADAGLIVLAAFISPFRAERDMVRAMLREGEFVEVFVDTPLADAEARDVKGLYAKARRGELTNFTGIDSSYEPPQRPELVIDTRRMSAEQAADAIVALLN